MKRPILLIPVLAVLAAIAIGAVAIAGSNGGSGTGTTSNSTNNGGGLYGSSAPSSPAPKPAAAKSAGARIGAADHGLGAMLVDGQGRTLYLWKADTGAMSTCAGECAQDWPPVTTSGAPHAGGAVKAAMLGTTKRSDGTTQVTYAGHPLYRFAGDAQAGQANGQGSNAFGAAWLVVAPSTGAAIQG
jgi:predicted lipoprotein with Yx(FWY)xxD motif